MTSPSNNKKSLTSNHSYWLPRHSKCPRLFLAPMEGLGDAPFRRAFSKAIGGYDEACTEFIRVPRSAHVESLAKAYNPLETAPYPQAAQIMGEDKQLLSEMAQILEKKGAPRIDLNCGCPSSTVVGRGAGSSLLKEPDRLHQIVSKLVQAVNVPLSVKIRSGYLDTSLFKENLLAIESAGATFITIHPRTKVEGYGPPANWLLIRQAKELVNLPIVGSGDILSGADAYEKWKMSGCDGLMVGRGALSHPLIFHEIFSYFTGKEFDKTPERVIEFLRQILEEWNGLETKTQVNKLKQLCRFLFLQSSDLQEVRKKLLTKQTKDPHSFLEEIINEWLRLFSKT